MHFNTIKEFLSKLWEFINLILSLILIFSLFCEHGARCDALNKLQSTLFRGFFHQFLCLTTCYNRLDETILTNNQAFGEEIYILEIEICTLSGALTIRTSIPTYRFMYNVHSIVLDILLLGGGVCLGGRATGQAHDGIGGCHGYGGIQTAHGGRDDLLQALDCQRLEDGKRKHAPHDGDVIQ